MVGRRFRLMEAFIGIRWPISVEDGLDLGLDTCRAMLPSPKSICNRCNRIKFAATIKSKVECVVTLRILAHGV